MMDEKKFSEIIQELAKDLVPKRINLWPNIQQELEDKNFLKLEANMKIKQPRIAIGIMASIVLLVVVLTLSPIGKTFAQVIQDFFKVKEIEEVATFPVEKYRTPTIAPTFIPTLNTVESTASPIMLADPTEDPALAPCYDDLYGASCKIAQAEKIAGFDAKQFPRDPEGLALKRVETFTNQIILEYHYINWGNYLFLKQGIADEFPDYGGVPADAIEEVMVGIFPGQFVAGMYVNVGDPPIVQWLDTDRYRLRWMEGSQWFEIDSVTGGPPEIGTYSDKNFLIGIALSLVLETEQQNPRAEYLTTIQDAALFAGFIPQEPGKLPADFQFDHGEYDVEQETLRLIYTPKGEKSLYGTVIVMQNTHETLANLFHDELEWDEVYINGYPGGYFSRDPFFHLVYWSTDDIHFLLEIWTHEWGYGATLTKDQVLEIANSIR
jgi:hypothetical protein